MSARRLRGLRRAGDGLTTALVTGASSGIGLSMARILADLGYDLVLVSERAEELEAAAVELRARAGHRVEQQARAGVEHRTRAGVEPHSRAGVEQRVSTEAVEPRVPTVTTIVLDLARASAADELVAEVAARGLEIDVLINNAGFFFFGEAVDADPARAAALLQLHVVTPSLLCTRFGAAMRARRRGHILLVSSLSAWNDFPGIAYYGASKRYLLGFGRSLRSELRVWNVWVTCLAPGATATGLYDQTAVDVARARRLKVMMDADAVAEAGLRGMFRRRGLVVPGIGAKAMTVGAWLAPRWLLELVRAHGPWMRDGGAGEREG